MFGSSPLRGSPHNLQTALTYHAGLPLPLLPTLPFVSPPTQPCLSPRPVKFKLPIAVYQILGIRLFLSGSPSSQALIGAAAPGPEAFLPPGIEAQVRALPTTCLPFAFSPVTSRDAWTLCLCFGLLLSYQSLCINVHHTFSLRDPVEGVARSTWPLPGWQVVSVGSS